MKKRYTIPIPMAVIFESTKGMKVEHREKIKKSRNQNKKIINKILKLREDKWIYAEKPRNLSDILKQFEEDEYIRQWEWVKDSAHHIYFNTRTRWFSEKCLKGMVEDIGDVGNIEVFAEIFRHQRTGQTRRFFSIRIGYFIQIQIREEKFIIIDNMDYYYFIKLRDYTEKIEKILQSMATRWNLVSRKVKYDEEEEKLLEKLSFYL